ncbi:MAG TPA: hypothetical protein VGL93_02220 [Streptosporangiaceae bacterium]
MDRGRYAAGSRPRFGVRFVGGGDPERDVRDLLGGEVLKVTARLGGFDRTKPGELVLALGADDPVVWRPYGPGKHTEALTPPLRIAADTRPRGRLALLLGKLAWRVLDVRTGTGDALTLVVSTLDAALVHRAFEEAES